MNRRSAFLVAMVLLWGCDDAKYDPSPLRPIPHGPNDLPPMPPGPPVLPAKAAEPELPEVDAGVASLPTTGAFTIAIERNNEQTQASWRGAIHGTSGWARTSSPTTKKSSELEVHQGELGAAGPALFSKLDALRWHLLPSATGAHDGTLTTVTIERGEVHHVFTVDGKCDCPSGEAIAAIERAFGKLPTLKNTTAVSTVPLANVSKKTKLEVADCHGDFCSLRSGKGKSLTCYPTTLATARQCIDAPWKSKGVLVRSNGMPPGGNSQRPWAMTLPKNVTCQLNEDRAMKCSDGRTPREVLPGAKSWFALFGPDEPVEPISKVFLLP